MSASETHTASNRFRFLAEAVAWRYRKQGFVVSWAVHRRLLGDPVYRELLMTNRLPTEGLVLDLGCDRGVFLALLACAQTLGMGRSGMRRVKPQLMGIELCAAAAESARLALAGQAEIITGDLRHTALPPCRTAVLLDVLLYLEPEEQDGLLERIAAVLQECGLLILREPDGEALRQRLAIRLSAGFSSLLGNGQGHRLYPRSGADWKTRLESLGLRVESHPEKSGIGLSKMLLIARKPGCAETP